MDAAAALRDRRRIVMVAVLAITGAWLAAMPQGAAMGVDQHAFAEIIERMRGGAGYYDAFRDGFLDLGISVSQGRAFRMPTTFLVWRAVPADLLYPAYLAFVVVGTSWIMLHLTQRPLVVLPVTLYLLHAGVTFDRRTNVGMDAWLLQELWVLPFVCGSVLAWRTERWGTSAVLAGMAVLVREITIPLLLGGLLWSHLHGRPRRPWLVVLGVVVGLILLHWAVAARVALPSGNEAPLLGSGQPPESVLEMMDWPIPGPLILGGILWIVAIVELQRRGEMAFLGPYLAIGLSGLLVRRPYWGITFVPLTILLSLEMIASHPWWPRRPAAASMAVSPADPATAQRRPSEAD